MSVVKRQKAKGENKGAVASLLSLNPFPPFLLLPLAFCLFTFSFSLSSVFGQDDPPDLAPPPVRTVTKDERARLSVEVDVKARTKLALEMMNTRIVSAEQLNSHQDFDGMFRELGGFQGLLDHTLGFLTKSDTDDRRSLDNYKRFEIGLRGFMPRLETIRRDLPLRYEDYVRGLITYVRDARSRAIEPLFGNTVVTVQKPDQHPPDNYL